MSSRLSTSCKWQTPNKWGCLQGVNRDSHESIQHSQGLHSLSQAPLICTRSGKSNLGHRYGTIHDRGRQASANTAYSNSDWGQFLNNHGQLISPVLTEKPLRWSLEMTKTASQQHCLWNMDEIPLHIFSSVKCMSWAVSKKSKFPE